MAGSPPLDEDEYRRWREEADRALAGANLLAEAGLYNWACFSAEQAAQLAMKGLLHGVGGGPWGHDLPRLSEMAGEGGLEVPAALQDIFRRLGRHYIPARYPDAHPAGPPGRHYGEKDSRDAIGDAEEVLRFVDETWAGLHG